MWLCDVNVWLALALSGHRHHAAATSWLDSIETPGSLLFCRATQQALLRLLTHHAVLTPYGVPPLTNRVAWEIWKAFLGDDRIVFKGKEPAMLESHWRTYALRDTASSKLWMDAYLAAYARAGNWRLVTFDAAFRQFDGLDLLLLGRT